MGKKSGLGKALIKSRFGGQTRAADGSVRHTTTLDDGTAWARMQSVTQESDLDAFLNTAQLAGTEFTAERLNVHVVPTSERNQYVLTPQEEAAATARHRASEARLTIPRRPAWDETTTPAQLDEMERGSFLEWRRGLAQLEEEEGLLLTPFERNLEVWRQLWRVIERSDLVAQIVDARNPLLFRNHDITKYVLETAERQGREKANVLIINKADLLQPAQRRAWAEYLDKAGIAHVFFSAAEAAPELAEAADVAASQALLDALALRIPESRRRDATGKKPTVGLLGYPNVGKSSTINALVSRHAVSVSSTPGKTKHFQTLELDDLVLCDCPGLVFPSFSTTKADQVVNGILPIDQLREWTGPTQLLCDRIPKAVFRQCYGLVVVTRDAEGRPVDRPATASELASAYAVLRGFRRNTQGQPDEARAARYLLKDHVHARTLYCVPPPTVTDARAFNAENVHATRRSLVERGAAAAAESGELGAMDAQFFESLARERNDEIPDAPQVRALAKGQQPVGPNGFSRAKLFPSADTDGVVSSKKHNKQNRKRGKQRTQWVDA